MLLRNTNAHTNEEERGLFKSGARLGRGCVREKGGRGALTSMRGRSPRGLWPPLHYVDALFRPWRYHDNPQRAVDWWIAAAAFFGGMCFTVGASQHRPAGSWPLP